MLPCLVLIPEESEIPAVGRAINLWLAGDRVPQGLIQELAAPIALFGDV
jgi:hypothetical protein